MFPVTDSNLSADSLVEQVLSQYDLGAVRRCRLHHRGLNDTYKVESSQDHTYFLRVYRADWRSREEIDTESAILLHLAQQDVHVSSRWPLQVILRLIALKGVHFALPSIGWNCLSDRCIL